LKAGKHNKNLKKLRGEAKMTEHSACFVSRKLMNLFIMSFRRLKKKEIAKPKQNMLTARVSKRKHIRKPIDSLSIHDMIYLTQQASKRQLENRFY
jgi:hypothetical protein